MRLSLILIPWLVRADKDCSTAVSTDGVTLNTECVNMCSVGSSSFEQRCSLENYNVISSEAVEPTGTCFTNWVPGYSDEGALNSQSTSQVGEIFVDVKTPWECQMACQKSSTCAFWIQRVVKTSTTQIMCLLKSFQLLTGAANSIIDTNSLPPTSSTKWNFCNWNMGTQCATGGYSCLKCQSGNVCIWKDRHFISGKKFCSKAEDYCDGMSITDTTTTTKPTDTTTTTKPTDTTTTTKPTDTTTTTKPTDTTTTTKPTDTTTTTKPTDTTTTTKPTDTTTTTTKSSSTSTQGTDSTTTTTTTKDTDSTTPSTPSTTTTTKGTTSSTQGPSKPTTTTTTTEPPYTSPSLVTPIAAAGGVGVALIAGGFGLNALLNPSVPDLMDGNFNDAERAEVGADELIANVDEAAFS